MTERAIVLLETSGNQRHIFATNKLRENVGASEHVYRCCRTWLVEALSKRGGSTLSADDLVLADQILDPKINPPIDSAQQPYEVVVAGSGTATVLTGSRDAGVNLVDDITRRALHEAPGLTIRGAVETYDADRESSLREGERQARRRLRDLRAELPAPTGRYLRLPIIDECANSGLPASRVGKDPDGREVRRSEVSWHKHTAARGGLERQRKLVRAHVAHLLPKNAAELENMLDRANVRWLGVLHADGNGLGQRFIDLAQAATSDREYVKRLRAFSLAVERCSLEAFRDAATRLLERQVADQDDRLSMLPLILGGDDITVLLDGRAAIAFAVDFLRSLEHASGNRLADANLPQASRDALRDALDRELGLGERLTASAGVAVVKPHFPFHAAYELAHDLRAEAKTANEQVMECSALSFHVLYDSSEYRLDQLRKRMEVKAGGRVCRLHARPYVVGDHLSPGPWLDRHSIQILAKRARQARQLDVPRSALAALRAAAQKGPSAADDTLARLLAVRPETTGLAALCVNGASLFWKEDGRLVTDLLDLLETREVWTPEPES